MTLTESKILPNQQEKVNQIKKIDYVEFYVSNAQQAAYFYQTAFGFKVIGYAGLETGVREYTSYLLEQGNIHFILTSPLISQGHISDYIKLHGDGVYDIALLVDNVENVFQTAVNKGAKSILEPTLTKIAKGYIIKATLAAYQGDLSHSLIERHNYNSFLPQYYPISSPQLVEGVGLIEIDHVVINTELGNRNKWTNFYENIFQFYSYQEFRQEDIATEYSALTSTVLTNQNGQIKFPINEPVEGRYKSQIQEYLDFHMGSGVQHIALRTNDIIKTVKKLRLNGVKFLEIPDAYYDRISEKANLINEDINSLKELKILLDQDEKGYLLQIFTKPLASRPTFFIEIIQREGSPGFGQGNFKALFEAIEVEQAARGNL
ncbi:4-hydroxyphenylpyruvate dioxygenase [Aphanothece sacrum]|uniref:4-hydroxyphenylpyruvate dioxygenase n=1 Tax=Aphanothece sacrum FPU1 TaxID=1920663 RepID=A0A401ICQ7_APHSA|nr:4-hydroxyphenylpyruvate dioxygenase [Aphanothece sacrum]GBF79078.1 4-hydroxyphenylpyruvate dioxygenase [Aphanothece sacrum FPU1]GBF85124.1 4-hydroxyphenylpyruvate dioxygenase [Aphanothece sacrum FPU3]